MRFSPSAVTRIRAMAGWLILVIGLSATCLLFGDRLGLVQLSGGEPANDRWRDSFTEAFSATADFLLPLAAGHFLGLGILWFLFSTAPVPCRLRQIARLGAVASIIHISWNVSSVVACFSSLVAHGANLTFWLLVESARERRSSWDNRGRTTDPRTTDPMLTYGMSAAAVAALMVALERGRELQSTANSAARADAMLSPSADVPAQALPQAEEEIAVGTARKFSEQLRQAAQASTVRIINRSGKITGSGTVVFAGPAFACILTAAHLVRFGDEIIVDFFDGDQLRRGPRSIRGVEVWGLDPRNDLAMLWVPADARLQTAMKICPRQYEPLDSDVTVLALACPDNGPPASYFETVTRRVVRKRATAEPVQIWEGERVGFHGQSGGALVDQQGWVVGVRSGIADGKAYYAHHSAIHAFLQSSELYRRSAATGVPGTHADLLQSLFNETRREPFADRSPGARQPSN